ncbi:MAG TPA: penicillin-insensitive murein endopeptidase [Polyangiaceae bacterium]|nr:penicillin-insensitive murein endopeptidase [Polyangiaceae bacterium]
MTARLACAWAATLALSSCSYSPSPLTPHCAGSVGSPTHGTLSSGAELPTSGPGYRWLNPNGHHYGVPRLVEAVAGAAAEVERQRPGGAPLMIGDLSRRAGGRIPRHASHRSGRDVDLLFYAETPAGEPVTNPGFLKFGPDGLALVPNERGGGRYIRLDLAREWLLIKSLLGAPEANVQWMFVSLPLEALITDYARARGEDPELVWHAETVMLQPRDSLPHDDHLHLRTACTPDEAVMGCEGGGPYWPWLPALPTAPPPETDEALAVTLLSEPALTPRSASEKAQR